MSSLGYILIYAVAGGLLPALIWLWFWLSEDKERPEPLLRVGLSFIAGALGVPLAFILQLALTRFIGPEFAIPESIASLTMISLIGIFSFAAIEEIIKFVAAYFSALRTPEADESVDVLVYVIAAALGFAAAENMLFIILPLLQGNALGALITAHLRFVGANLLHIATTATLGTFIAFEYFDKPLWRRLFGFLGIIAAIGLHALFNLFIITHEGTATLGFILVWIINLLIIVVFEKLKRIHVNKI